MKQALIIIHTNTFFTELFRVGSLLALSGKINPLMVFYPYPTCSKDAALSREHGLACIDKSGEPVSINSPSIRTESFIVGGLIKVFHKIDSILDGSLSLVQDVRIVQRLIEQTQPSIVIMAGDNVDYDSSIYIKFAHRRGIPVVLVPSTMSNGLEQAEVYYANPRYNAQIGVINRLVGKIYPNWLRHHKDKWLLRTPGIRIILMEWLKIAPPVPWMFNSGYADAIAVESEALLKYYLDGGLSPEQLVSTGSPANDVLARISQTKEVQKRILCTKLDFDINRPILLSAIPPDCLYMMGGRPDCEFASYEALLDNWIGGLAKTTHFFNVVLCVHPSVNILTLSKYETSHIRLCDWNTVNLIPLCDVFVASVSSTIRWAIAAGVPVVNYDVYQYHYTDYLQEPGVQTLYNNTDFSNALRKLSDNPNELLIQKERQSERAEYWGLLDGKAGNRLMSLFESLIEKQK
jgi:hypothetical protein